MISLPTSGVKAISLWVIVVVSFIGGLFSGFLGGGAGYIRMPMMVYILGIPTHLAVGTDLFEIIISASYGTFSHAIKGNVDILVALVMNTGAAIGAQIGAILTQYFAGPKIRLLFRSHATDWRRDRPLHLVYRTQALVPDAYSYLQRRHRSRGQPDAARRPDRRALPIADHPARHRRERRRTKSRSAARSKAKQKCSGKMGVSPEIVVRAGEPIRQILAETTANEYDLAVIGARRKGSGGLYWRPEKTYEVIKAVPPPVLVAIGACDRLQRILVCTGGKKYIDDAVQLAGEIAKCVGGRDHPPARHGGTARDLCRSC